MHATPSTNGTASRRTTAVTGTFEDKADVERALASLTHRDVPAEAIDLVVIDGEGLHPRGVSGSASSGWQRTLAIGVATGVALASAVGILAVLGVTVVPVEAPTIVPGSILGTTVFGLGLGGALGMLLGAAVVRLRGERRVPLSSDEAREKVIVVSVRGEALADAAREGLAEAGATRISG